MSRYTEQQREFLREAIPGHTWREVSALFEAEYGRPLTKDQVNGMRKSLGVASGKVGGLWTAEQIDFLRGYVPGHSYAEAVEALRERFGIERTGEQIHRFTRTYGVKCGVNKGAFKKGREAWCKGKRAKDFMAPEHYEKFMRANARRHEAMTLPLGTERVDTNGYVVVCVQEGGAKRSDRWRLKHHVVWEHDRRRPLPDGYLVVFADGDRFNFDPANLVAVPRNVLGVMNGHGMRWHDVESLHVCMAMAFVRMAVKRKREELEEGAAA